MKNLLRILASSLIALALVVPASADDVSKRSIDGLDLYVHVTNPGLVKNRCLARWNNGPAYAEMQCITATPVYCVYKWTPGYRIVLPTTFTAEQRETMITKLVGVIRSGRVERSPRFF